jgi:hypothetical protein
MTRTAIRFRRNDRLADMLAADIELVDPPRTVHELIESSSKMAVFGFTDKGDPGIRSTPIRAIDGTIG